MVKLSGLFQCRNQLSEKLSFGKAGEIIDTLWLRSSTSQAGISTASQTVTAKKGNLTDRILAPYSIYKGKAALSVEPVAPKFAKSDSGILRVDRRGVMMLCFTPAIGERKYDWSKKQFFALSATEVGSLISLGAQDSCEFFHDPSMKSSNAGQVRKSLSIKAIPDGGGYFISLGVVNNILKTTERFSVPATTAEFAVMKTACSFALPHIMGWDCLINQLPSAGGENPSKVEPQHLSLEWDK